MTGKGVHHRDLHPDNILVWKRTATATHAYIVDFGLALSTSEGNTQPFEVCPISSIDMKREADFGCRNYSTFVAQRRISRPSDSSAPHRPLSPKFTVLGHWSTTCEAIRSCEFL